MSVSCSSRGPEFDSQHNHLLTTAPGNLVSAGTLISYNYTDAHTYIQIHLETLEDLDSCHNTINDDLYLEPLLQGISESKSQCSIFTS